MTMSDRHFHIVRKRRFLEEAADIRESLGLTQGDLAQMLGVSPTTISRWERGESVPRGYMAIRWHMTLRDLQRQQEIFARDFDGVSELRREFREIIYVAAPLIASRSHVDHALGEVANKYPDARVVDGTTAFADNLDFKAMWPQLARTVDHVVVVPDEDGTIGSGVHREIRDARRHGLAVEVLIGGAWLSIHDVELVKVEPFTPARAYRIVTRN